MNKIYTLLHSLRQPFFVLLCCLSPALSRAQASGWISIAPSNTPKWVGHPVVVNDKMYVFSGFDNASVHTTDKNEVYDPLTNQWTYVVPMPHPVTHAGAVADGDKVYISGGFLGSNAATSLVQVYHIPSNTWSLGPALPAASSSHALVRVGRRLHSLGGLLPDRKTDTGLHYVLDLEKPELGWEMAAPLPFARNHIASAVVAGKIYVLGGQQGHDGPTLEVPYVHVYDPVTDTWSRLRDLPYGRSHSETATVVADGKITLIGGVSPGENYLNTITTYDPASNTWSEQAPLPAKIFGPSASVIGQELIVSNGSLESRTNPQSLAYKRNLSRVPQYTMGFAPARLSLVAAAGSTVTGDALLWSLSGSPAYTLAGTLPPWLSWHAASGSIDPEAGTQLTITANTAGLAPGTYSATLRAQAAGYPDAELSLELQVVTQLPGVLYLYGSIPPAVHDMKLSDTGARGLSLFRRSLQQAGFSMTEALDASLTLDSATLAPYRVLVLGSNNRRFTEAEAQAVARWVQAGGGLVAWSDAAFGWSEGGINSRAGALSDNDLTRQFGMEFLRDNGAPAFTLNQWAASHYINLFNKDRGLTIEAEGASPIRTSAPATILAYLPASVNRLNSLDGAITANDAAMAVARIGQGRVLGLFDRNAFWNAGEGTWLSRVDNRAFALRLMAWAAGADETEGPMPPQLVEPLADITVQKNSAPTQLTLSRAFSDNGGGANLSFSISGNSRADLVTTAIQGQTLTLSYTGLTGLAAITVRATDSTGLAVEDLFEVSVVDTIIVPKAQQLISFSLINADTDREIKVLETGDTLNLATLPTRNLNIRANTDPGIVGSVKLSLTGAQTKNVTESGAPYALFGDNGGNYYAWVPARGTFHLTGTPYTNSGGGGTAGTPLSTSFTIVDAAAGNLLPSAQAGPDQTLTLPTNSLSLTGSGSDADGSISAYSWTKQSGPAATLANANTATLTASGLVAGSYLFRLTVTDNAGGTAYDEVVVTVNSAPANVLPTANAGTDKTLTLPTNSISLAGSGSDADGSISAYSWTKQSGPAATLANANTATLTASGLVAGSYLFRLSVTDNAGGTAYDEVVVTVNSAPASGQQLVSFTLINADNEQDLFTLSSGDVLNLATLPHRSLNIRANTNPAVVGSVKMALTGTQNKYVTESGAPYALYGDNSGNYYSWTPPVGNYTLTGTPYTWGGGSGTAGTSLTISFQVVDQAPAARLDLASTTAPAGGQVLAYPNPVTAGRFRVSLPMAMAGEVTYELVSALGRQLARGTVRPDAGGVLRFDFARQMQARGIYFLRLNGENLNSQLKLMSP